MITNNVGRTFIFTTDIEYPYKLCFKSNTTPILQNKYWKVHSSLYTLRISNTKSMMLPNNFSVRCSRIQKSYFETFFGTFLWSVVWISFVGKFQQSIRIVTYFFSIAPQVNSLRIARLFTLKHYKIILNYK